ncbi:MAG: hypothetical protein QW230_05095 [Thermofilum sp.]
MMVKIEKEHDGYRITLPDGVLTVKSVNIDEEEVDVGRTLYVEAVKVEVDEDGEVWIYTIAWALDDAIFRLETRLVKTIIGGRSG